MVMFIKTRGIFTGMEQLVAFSLIAVALLAYSSIITIYSGSSYANAAISINTTLSYYQLQQISYELFRDNNSYLNFSGTEVKLYNIIGNYSRLSECDNFTINPKTSCGVVSHDGKIYILVVDSYASK
ncbi:MAG: hypothetical protein QXR73_00310 [Candidatus Micrarchaeaceae archaeon]